VTWHTRERRCHVTCMNKLCACIFAEAGIIPSLGSFTEIHAGASGELYTDLLGKTHTGFPNKHFWENIGRFMQTKAVPS